MAKVRRPRVRALHKRLGLMVDPWPETEARIDAKALLARMDEREAYAVFHHFLGRTPLREVAADLGVSKSVVQRLLRRGLFELLVAGCK